MNDQPVQQLADSSPLDRLADAFDAIRPVVLDVMCVDPSWFRPEAVLAEAPGADSLDIVELQVGLEDSLDLVLPDDEMDKVVTVLDLAELVDRKLTARANP